MAKIAKIAKMTIVTVYTGEPDEFLDATRDGRGLFAGRGVRDSGCCVLSLTWPGNAIRRLLRIIVRARWVPGRLWWGSVPTRRNRDGQDSFGERTEHHRRKEMWERLRGRDLI